MLTHNHIDEENIAEVLSSTTASTAAVSEKFVDIGQEGGRDSDNLRVVVPSASKSLTVKMLHCETEDGVYTELLAFATTAETEFVKQMRVPLEAHRYIKLQVTTGSAAPDQQVTAQLFLLS